MSRIMNAFLFRISAMAIVCSLALAGVGMSADASEKGYESMGGPYADDPRLVQQYRLDNGLEVYLAVCPDEPRFYAEIAVRAGSKNDPPDATGLAHYMEHLLFKGSQKLGTLNYEAEKAHLERITELYERHFHATDPEERKAIYQEITEESTRAAVHTVPNELDRIYSALGAKGLNAHTWVEEVVYKVDLPANCLEQWAKIESDRFSDPVFRLFQTELETVYEEMNRAQDNKDRIIIEAVADRVFKVHPYGQQTTLGKVEHLKSPSLKKLEDFYQTWYVPNNMAIFIAGDIDPDETMEIINRHFSHWEAKALPEPQHWEEEPLQGREAVTVSYEGEEYVLLAFRTVPHLHPDRHALLMVDMILDNSEAGLINLNLNKKQRVQKSGAYPLFYNDYGLQYLYGVPKEGQSKEEVEQLLLDQLRQIREGDFPDWLIPAIINYFQKEEKQKLESYNSYVSVMRNAWLAYEPWKEACRFIDRMAEVTREDVIRVANEYFGDDYVAGYRIDAPHEPPLVEKPPLPEIVIDAAAQSDFAREVLQMPQPAIDPVFVSENKDFQRVTDERGVTLIHTPNPFNDLFSLSFVVGYGNRQDKKMAAATALFQKTGTESKSPDELQIEWFKRASTFKIIPMENEVLITLSGLDNMLEESLALLKEMLDKPQVDEETLTNLKSVILKSQADQRKDPSGLMAALSAYNAYGDESSALQRLPSEELMLLTTEELQEVMRKLLSFKHHVLYTGSLPVAAVQEHLNKFYDCDAVLSDPPPYRLPVIRTPEENEIYLSLREMGQAHIMIQFPGVLYDPALMAQVNLFNDYLSGGMSGLVFQELREVRALAYAVYAWYIPGQRRTDQNSLMGVIQTQADKALDALKAFNELIDEMPLSPQRFANSRETILKDFAFTRTRFRDVPSLVLSWERKNISPDPREAVYRNIQAMDSIDSLAEFHKQHIAGKAKLISIVGDPQRLDLEALAAFAKMRTLEADTLFAD
ncbi:MAG: insulinase family protein [Candidatus Hydrogenedens sp.]|nr:insulinase family protein [Candidatus Hydrogenedens sp.]